MATALEPGEQKAVSVTIAGYDTASPVMRVFLRELSMLGPVRQIGPGRWLATCPCCGENEGAEYADVWAGVELSRRRPQ